MSESAPIVSQELATMADGFNDRMSEMQGRFTAVGLGIAENILPFLDKWLDGVERIAKAMGLVSAEEEYQQKRQAGRNKIISQFATVMEKDKADREKYGLGARSGAVEIGGLTLREALAAFDRNNPQEMRKTPAKTPSKGIIGEGAAPKGVKKAIAGTEVDVQELFGDMGTSVDFSQFESPDYYAGLPLSDKAKASLDSQFQAEKQRELDEIEKRKQEQIQAYDAMAQGMSSAFASAFDDIWRDGRNVFGALWDSFSELFTQRVIQSFADLAASSLMNAFAPGSGAIASLLFSARGNEVGAGVPSVVGERRAETIVPRGPVRVEPTASAAGTVVINVQNPAQAMSIKRQIEREDRRRTRGIR